MRTRTVAAAVLAVAAGLGAAAAQGPPRPALKLWLEGNAGPWGPDNPFFATRTAEAKELLVHLNRRPSTAAEVQAAFAERPAVAGSLAALERAALVRARQRGDGAVEYLPTVAILTAADQAALEPVLRAAADAYAARVQARLEELDAVLAEAGLGAGRRLPVYMAFVRDACFYELMDARGLFPTAKAACPVGGEGNVYGAEDYEPLAGLAVYGLTHAQTGRTSVVLIYPFGLEQAKLLRGWGYAAEWDAKGDIARLLDACRERPAGEEALAAAVAGSPAAAHVGGMLAMLEEAGAVSRRGDRWTATPARLTRATLARLCALADDAAEPVIGAVNGPAFEAAWQASAAGRNGVSLPEFREAVAWRTIWATGGLLAARGVFPPPSGPGPGLTVFDVER